MPITALDEETALVLIDLQKGVVSMPLAHEASAVIQNAAKLIEAFKKAGLPVIAVNVAFAADGADALKPRCETNVPLPQSQDWAELMPELPLDATDLRITKHNWNAFYGTELDLQLRRRKITGIVLAGISTSIGVEGTARAAYERGYNISFASDAITDRLAGAHEHSFTVIFPRIGEIGSTSDIIAELQKGK